MLLIEAYPLAGSDSPVTAANLGLFVSPIFLFLYVVSKGSTPMTRLLFAALRLGDSQPRFCRYSGWHSSGYYDCRFGPWQRDEQTVEPPRRRERECDQI